jgi:hypothetical protein
VDEPNTDLSAAVGNFFGGLKNYQHNKLLEDLPIPGMTVKEFWNMTTKIIQNLSMESFLFQNMSM